MKILISALIGVSALLFIALTFSHLIILFAPLLIGGFVWYTTKMPRKLLKTKFTPISLLNEGLIKVSGTISASATYFTPYFKQECIGYNYKKANITYDSETGSENEREVTIEEQFQDFYLTDATGKVKVTAPKFNLAFLPAKTDTIHSIKYAVADVRHTERTLKNGDSISIMGYARKNDNYGFDIIEKPNHPLVISNAEFENESKKSFKTFKYLLPYIIIMYLSVNYFVFLAPVHHWPKNDALVVFGFFGVPILGLIFGALGNREIGFFKVFFSVLGGTLLLVSLLSFPLLCLLLITKTAFYTTVCVWLCIFFSVLLGFSVNHKKLRELAE